MGVGAFAADSSRSVATFSLQTNDVAVILGGAIVAQELEASHLESLLTAAFPGRGVRFRNMGWEGDTVFEQPRMVGFPTIQQQLQRVGATVIFVQFGQMECLSGGHDGLAAFTAAYEKFCDALAKQTSRVVLLTPSPLEKTSDPLLPDLAARNGDMKLYVDAIRAIAARRGLQCVDLFSELGSSRSKERLTSDGLQLTPRGHGFIALAMARQLGLEKTATRTGAPGKNGEWSSPQMESLRQAIIAKNRLWFDYLRPMNWAFLGGDRVSVPSSRDHRDPNVRWFPAEMETFVPLIEAQEKRVNELASALK